MNRGGAPTAEVDGAGGGGRGWRSSSDGGEMDGAEGGGRAEPSASAATVDGGGDLARVSDGGGIGGGRREGRGHGGGGEVDRGGGDGVDAGCGDGVRVRRRDGEFCRRGEKCAGGQRKREGDSEKFREVPPIHCRAEAFAECLHSVKFNFQLLFQIPFSYQHFPTYIYIYIYIVILHHNIINILG